jgi:two-component system response regulator
VSKKRLILMVEDNADDELLTLDVLRGGGEQCEIIVARDGAEALDYLFATGAWAGRDPAATPSLVLLDLKLPKVSGFEVLNRIRANEQTRLIPVVLLTSSSEEEDMMRGYSSGANSFVRKPVEFERFAESVRQLGDYWLQVNEVPAR